MHPITKLLELTQMLDMSLDTSLYGQTFEHYLNIGWVRQVGMLKLLEIILTFIQHSNYFDWSDTSRHTNNKWMPK